MLGCPSHHITIQDLKLLNTEDQSELGAGTYPSERATDTGIIHFNTVTDLGLTCASVLLFCFGNYLPTRNVLKRQGSLHHKFPVATVLFISTVSFSQVNNLDDGGICILARC